MKEETTNGGEGSKNGGRKWRRKARNSDGGARSGRKKKSEGENARWEIKEGE